MTAILIPSLIFQGWLPNGLPAVGGLLSSYAAGTSTPQATYIDSTQTTQNSNPVVLNASGQAAIWLDPTKVYKFVLTDILGNPLGTTDQVQGSLTAAALGPILAATLTQTYLGAILTPQTPIELANSVVPVNIWYPPGHAYRYGAVDDNATDNATAFGKINTLANAFVPIYFPKLNTAVYRSSVPLLFTNPFTVSCDRGVIILLTSSASYVLGIQPVSGGIYESYLGPFILDAGGNAADALMINGLYDSTIDRVRVRNSSANGIHIKLAQSCVFYSLTCAPAIDTSTTIPNNGLLVDTASSANNDFFDATFWGLTGKVGINAPFLLGSTFIGGQSESNGIGIILGAASVGSAFGNIVMNMDLEGNSTADVQILATAYGNNLIGLTSAGLTSINGGNSNHIYGGVMGAISLDAASANNTIRDVSFTAGSTPITDSGSANTYSGLYNVNTGFVVPDKYRRGTAATSLSTTGAVATNAAVCLVTKITYSGAGAGTITISNPTNPLDGMVLYIRLHVTGAGAITLAMGGAFKGPTPTVAANGNNRTAQYLYDAAAGAWYFVDQSAVDIAN